MVTVVRLTPEEFPGELADTYPAACATLDIPPTADGYTLTLAQDADGARFTIVGTDVSGATTAHALWNDGILHAYQPRPTDIVATLPGWPIHCSLGLADRPEPHNPDPSVHGAPLHPPTEPDQRAPRSRRILADHIAAELCHRIGTTRREYEDAWLMHEYDFGNTDPEPIPPRIIDHLVDLGQVPADLAATVDQALTVAWSLATAQTPPLGVIRAKNIHPHARLVRALGDGWSFIARSDNPAILLVDQAPGVSTSPTHRGPAGCSTR